VSHAAAMTRIIRLTRTTRRRSGSSSPHSLGLLQHRSRLEQQMSTSTPSDSNARIIEQVRANGGRVSEPFENTSVIG